MPNTHTFPRLLPLLAVLATLPLLAVTCGQGNATGAHAFSRNSLIIPMDACYQGDGATTPSACPGAADPGNVLRAYGLVYQLLQHNIPVYWVIKSGKASLTDVDLTLSWSSGAPVGKYDWSSGAFSSPPPNNNTHDINYRGGPFIVDGAYLSQVNALMQSSGIKSIFGATGAVNVHVSNVAFTGNVAKAMNGGWNAGGATPPPIALLNITGADGINSLGVLQGYLDAAGLGSIPNAGGTASGSHGVIYDKLDYQDFLPSLASSNLGKNGYRVLWAPHWVGTCATAAPSNCLATAYSQSQLNAIRATIRDYVAGGRDFFAECSAITTLESGLEFCPSVYNDDTSSSAQLMTTTGMDYNLSGYLNNSCGRTYSSFTPLAYKAFASPFMQLAEFSFSGVNGAVANYRPGYVSLNSAWKSGVTHLISSTPWSTWDMFTLKAASAGSGNTLYLAGHDYKGQVAGTRLVLNTLFNLGSSCVSTFSPCDTGQLGVCAQGQLQCVNDIPTCVPTASASVESCDGLDNDCNGLVDDGVTRACYGGAAGTQGVGQCHGGVQTCANGAWAACAGEVTPTAEICNGLDDNCNGAVDDLPAQSCYEGPVGSAGVGACKAGTQLCAAGAWGACTGQALPGAESCNNGVDDNCDGQVDEGCGCASGATQPCYGGAAGTAGVGTCHAGVQLCSGGSWGSCSGQVVPAQESCNGQDDDCNGQTDEGGVCDACAPGQLQPCYGGAPATASVGLCKGGMQGCDGGQWETCAGQVLPAPELCNGLDDDCDGTVDDDPLCPAAHACVQGVCVPEPCGGELAICPEGFLCSNSHHCDPTNCGSAPCPTGQRCVGGACSDPCATVACGTGSVCAGGLCTGGGCYASGCDAGTLCQEGHCVADPCSAITCTAGTFCRSGFCVQSCAFRQCAQGERCNADGFCEPDACATNPCGAGERCEGGTCVTDACAYTSCGPGQVCRTGSCVDNPCNGVHCPVGTCVAGQCFGGLLQDGGTQGGADAGDVSDAGAQADAGTLPSSDAGLADAGSGAQDGGSASGASNSGHINAGSGCGCGTTPPESWTFLLLPLLALSASKKRSTRTAPALLITGLLSTLACGPVHLRPSADSLEDAGACAVDLDCPGTTVCVAGACVVRDNPSPGADGGSAPADAGAPDAGPACARCGTATCVDLLRDASHCGSCGTSCASGELCVDGACGPSALVAPRISTLSPAQLPQGAVAKLLVSGERFAQGASLHVGSGASAFDVAANVASAASLTADVDLTHAKPGLVELRVVNPGKVISNAATLQVTAAVPFISALTPTSAVEGTVVTLHVTGSGFLPDPGSRCKVSGPAIASQGLPTHGLGPTSLDCTWDLGSVQPGTYSVVVTNDGLTLSNAAAFTVVTATPVLTVMTPASGSPGAKLSLALHGSGFDVTSQVNFNGSPLPTTFVSRTELFASPLDLKQVAPGTYPVTVVNGGNVSSNALIFTVDPNPPHLSTLTPSSALQGQALQLDLTGTGFEAQSVVHVFEPGGANVPLPTTVISSTQLSAPFALTGKPAGNYLVEVITNGTLPSNALPLQVLSNVATLTSLSPAGGAQGTTVDLALAGTNFLQGAAAWISGNGLAATPLTTALTSATSASVTGLSLAGWRTGTYVISLLNPGAAASNQVGFTVFAGAPTLSAVAPTAAALGTTVSVTLTGTNFAQPDAQGLGGSTVHARCVACGVTDSVVPATVSSPTEIHLSFDTANAPPGTYELTVWNPGGNPPPQKTAAVTFTVTP